MTTHAPTLSHDAQRRTEGEMNMFYLFDELCKLDVKWAGMHVGNSGLLDFVHANPFYELIMVIEGPVYLSVEGRNLTLQSGEILLLSPWQQHIGWKEPHDQSSFFWVQFTIDPEPILVNSLSELENFASFLQADQNILRLSDENNQEESLMLLPIQFLPVTKFDKLSCFEKLYKLFWNPESYHRLRLSLKLTELIEMIASSALEHYQLNKKVSSAYKSYRSLAAYLNEYYAMELSKDEIEKNVDRKYEYLCHIFKKYSGYTINEYVHQLRIQSAKHYLISTDLPVYRVAEIIGYRDPYYFSKAFRKITGSSPSQYRKQHSELVSKSS